MKVEVVLRDTGTVFSTLSTDQFRILSKTVRLMLNSQTEIPGGLPSFCKNAQFQFWFIN